ncbi:hypothetical protein BGW36DRAFT_426906 [Talaromyces proteolyticus]|uniref:Uncharacterized protein n=1 Tax=Talaromyces proteolyticus TaxID=1131652 RepID=A0AAD4KVI5_9EURO|nr:uncharacterized protein BGW36DRAFT_426906 [Talaromyces proteolyticus]KAH8699234.1 hypothetical protein BGW36DRAFT_426906 [Talaromyces proteolyticus]
MARDVGSSNTVSKKWLQDNKYTIGFKQTSQYQAAVLKSKGSLHNTTGSLEEGKEIEHIEKVENIRASNTNSKWKIFKRHWRRFWCCYVVAGVVGLAIFLPLFFIYAFPAIAQLMVNNADLPIYSVMIMSPRPDNVIVSLQAGLTVPAGISVNLESITLSLFNRNVTPFQPYVAVNVPGQHLKGRSHVDISNQTVTILNKSQFVAFLREVVYSKCFTLSAKGSTTAHIGALKVPLTLNKDVQLNGLDALSGFSIQEAKLVRRESDGTNFRGVAVIPNYSIVSFALGNVTLNLKAADFVLGQGVIENVVLKPGNNTVDIKGSLSIATVLDNLISIAAAEKSAILKGNLELSASGNATIYEGVHITYYESVLNSLVMTADVPILEVLSDTISGLVGSNTTLSALLNGTNSTLSRLLNGTLESVGQSEVYGALTKLGTILGS